MVFSRVPSNWILIFLGQVSSWSCSKFLAMLNVHISFSRYINFESNYSDGLIGAVKLMSTIVGRNLTTDKDWLLEQSKRVTFWRHMVNSSERRPKHVADSSVVLLDRRKQNRTLHMLRQLLPRFTLGYGDKEIYWIAATVATSPFSFEPWLPGYFAFAMIN